MGTYTAHIVGQPVEFAVGTRHRPTLLLAYPWSGACVLMLGMLDQLRASQSYVWGHRGLGISIYLVRADGVLLFCHCVCVCVCVHVCVVCTCSSVCASARMCCFVSVGLWANVLTCLCKIMCVGVCGIPLSSRYSVYFCASLSRVAFRVSGVLSTVCCCPSLFTCLSFLFCLCRCQRLRPCISLCAYFALWCPQL